MLLVAILAGVLGFVAARQVAGTPKPPVELSVVDLPATPTPEPTPTETPGESARTPRTPRSPRSDSRCPAGCECSYPPPNGVVMVCHGG